MWISDKFQHLDGIARTMEPAHEQRLGRWARRRYRATSIAVLALLDANDWVIRRVRPNTPPIWNPDDWSWIASVERAVPEIRAELEAYLAGPEIPHVAEIAGYDPDSDEGRASVPVRVGAWRSILLFASERWIDETARHFPRTRACFEAVHPKSNVGFSALEGHSHIAAHVGSNRGALRLQVPIIVPGQPGQCRIRIGDEIVAWEEGKAIVFDLKVDHEAWNDADDLRVLLMVEIAQPLPWPASLLNRAAQRSLRWHPSYRGLPERIAAFGRQHDAPALASPTGS